jgi:hypothetical protein
MIRKITCAFLMGSFACSSVPPASEADAAAPFEASSSEASSTSDAPLPLGSVSSVTALSSCPAGAMPGATCSTIVVQCPGIEDLSATIAVAAPQGTATGTIYAHLGGGGTALFTANLQTMLQAGYRTFQIAWTTDWEQTSNAGILAAACRPATAMQWAYDNVHEGGEKTGFCGIGHSGGSGVLAYALTHYGMDRVLDYAQLQAGPPFGRIDYACAPQTYTGPARTLCPENTDAPIALKTEVGTWENTGDCLGTSATPAELAKWAADSVVSPGADFDYPHTPVDFIDCATNPNGTTGGAYFYSKAVTSSVTVTCPTDCSGESIGSSGATQAVSAMLAQCKPHP